MQEYAIKTQIYPYDKTRSANITNLNSYKNERIDTILNAMVTIRGCDCKVRVKDTFCPLGQATVYLRKSNGARIYY